MAMPASGCIAIRDNTLQTCSSIRTAVPISSSGSLSTLSVAAGKSTPHCMREFYSFAPKYISAFAYSCSGTQGSSATVYKWSCFPLCPSTGDCYDLCLKGFVWNYNQSAGAYGYTRLYCNSSQLVYCCISWNAYGGGLVTYCYGFNFKAGDTLCFLQYAHAANVADPNCVSTYICIDNITPVTGGYYVCNTACCVGNCSG